MATMGQQMRVDSVEHIEGPIDGQELCEDEQRLLDNQKRSWDYGEETGKWLRWYHDSRDYREHVNTCEKCLAIKAATV